MYMIKIMWKKDNLCRVCTMHYNTVSGSLPELPSAPALKMVGIERIENCSCFYPDCFLWTEGINTVGGLSTPVHKTCLQLALHCSGRCTGILLKKWIGKLVKQIM